MGTLPLLKLCLKNIHVICRESLPSPQESPDLHKEIFPAEAGTPVLVCPGPNAMSLEELRETEMVRVGSERRVTLIFVDGTWRQAKSMVYQSPCLKQLPRVVFTPSAPSGYKLRQPPEPGCLSTLECVAAA